MILTLYVPFIDSNMIYNQFLILQNVNEIEKTFSTIQHGLQYLKKLPVYMAIFILCGHIDIYPILFKALFI